jgi:hypothetical protein
VLHRGSAVPDQKDKAEKKVKMMDSYILKQ